MQPGFYQRIGKRSFDLILGTALAVVVLPVVLVLAIGSAVAFRAWPIFVQPRIGRGGRPFRFPKLRSMSSDANPTAEKRELAGEQIPSWGRFLRGTHLDELPQLLVVPFGRMSLVGPRPEMVHLADRYPRDLADARARVRPGCTGLWQIARASNGMIYETPEFDLAYVERCSWRLDAWILFRTLPAMLGRQRIGSVDDIPGWALPTAPSTPALPGPVADSEAVA